MEFCLNPEALEFVIQPENDQNEVANKVNTSKKVFKTSLFDYIKPKKAKKPKPDGLKPQNKNDEKMVKAHIIQDGQVVTAKIRKKDLYSGAYEVVARKTTKLKKAIKENRIEEGLPPNQRPLASEYQPREYVNQLLTADLDLAIKELLEKLQFYYLRQKEKKSNKKVQKRLVKGFKECIKKCADGSLKCLIMVPNIEKVEGTGGLDELVNELINSCKSKGVPIVFGLSLRELGATLINNATILAVVGILDYSSTEKLYENIIKLSLRNREEFKGQAYDPSLYFNIYNN